MNPEITRLRSTAHRDRNDVVELQEEPRTAAPPAVRIDVTAAATVAAPHFAPHWCRNVPGSTRPVGRLRAASGGAGGHRPRPRSAIHLRRPCSLRPCPLRWRRSVATAIRRGQRGRHALLWPWRRCGGVGPTIGHRLRQRSIGARRRRWLGTHRRAAAASLAPRWRRGQRCLRRGAGAANPARGFLRGPRCRRRGATGDRARRRRRHTGLLLRAPLRQRSRPAGRPFLRLRLPRLARACLPAPTSAPTSAPARRPPRVVALQAVLHQPLHELPQRQVRVHVRQQRP